MTLTHDVMLWRAASRCVRCVRLAPVASRPIGALRQQRTHLSSAPLDERWLRLEEEKLAVRREKLAAQREEAAAQRKLEEEKLAAQRKLEEEKLAAQRELSERKVARQAEAKAFQLSLLRADGTQECWPRMTLRRDEWASFQRHTARGPLFVMSNTGQPEQVINGFDGLVEGQAYVATPEQTLASRLSHMERSFRNRVSADEEAICEQLLAMMSPCIDGLAKAPEARRLYKWRDSAQLERFAMLV
ncbi:MAG: hypothetical protein ACPIOQ_78985, partial [Promethearchaeia archaeon]